MDLKMISADGENVSNSKRYFPFFDGENAFVYSGLNGTFYVSSNNKFIVNIDGKVKKIKRAIKEGRLEGMIWQNVHSECYIVQRLRRNSFKYGFRRTDFNMLKILKANK